MGFTPLNKAYYTAAVNIDVRISERVREKNNRTKDAILLKSIFRASAILFGKSRPPRRAERKKKKVRGLKLAVSYIHSLRRHFLSFFFPFDTMNQLSLVLRRHENCSAKIRYNHCRRARSETDSFRTSRERTAGNPSGGAYFFFLAFTLKILYRIIQGKVCAWLLSRVHSSREVSTLMLRVISLTLVDAARWSWKSITVKETAENYVVYRAYNLYFVS